MSASPGCPERATVETPRGRIVTGPVVECRTDASAETGAVTRVVVEVSDALTLEVPAEEATFP